MALPHMFLLAFYVFLFILNAKHMYAGTEIKRPEPKTSALVGMTLSGATVFLLLLGIQ